jgi:MFS family permease
MWSTDLVRGAIGVALTIAVAAQTGSIAVLAVAAFALGTAQTVFDNAASAILPMVVPQGRLERANSWLMSSELLASALVGPPVGATLYLVDHATPFGVDAVSFLAASALVGLWLPGSFRVTGSGVQGVVRSTSLWQEAVEGLRWLWGHPLLRTVCLLVTAISLAFTMAESLLVLYSARVLGLNGVGYSLLLAVVAVAGSGGGAAAGPVRSWWPRCPCGRLWCPRSCWGG